MAQIERKSRPRKNTTPAAEVPQEDLISALITDNLNDTPTLQESDMDNLDQIVFSDTRPTTINKADVHGVSISPMRSGKHTAYAMVILTQPGIASGLNGSTNDLWLNSAGYTLENGVSFDVITYRKVIYSVDKAMAAVSDLIPGFYPSNEVISETGEVIQHAPLSDEDCALGRAVIALIKLGKSEQDARARVGYTGTLPRFRLPKVVSEVAAPTVFAWQADEAPVSDL